MVILFKIVIVIIIIIIIIIMIDRGLRDMLLE